MVKMQLSPDFDPQISNMVLFETWTEPINNFIFGNGGSWSSPDDGKNLHSIPESAKHYKNLADLINVTMFLRL